MENWAIGMLFFYFFIFEQNGKNEKMVRINMIDELGIRDYFIFLIF